MKMEMKMKNRSHRYGINRPRSRDTNIVNIKRALDIMQSKLKLTERKSMCIKNT